MNTIRTFSAALVFAAALIATPFASTYAAEGDIVDTAVNTPQLSTLVQLVTDAELVSALQSEGPFTVFAPTNEAFAQLPHFVEIAIERDPELLGQILLYHVVAADITSADIPRSTRVESLAGEDVRARSFQGRVFINSSQVIIPDVETTNGTVHVINRVLIPWPVVIDSFLSTIRHN